jgi:hypothetical protein
VQRSGRYKQLGRHGRPSCWLFHSAPERGMSNNSEKNKYPQYQRKSWPLWDLPGQTVSRFFLGGEGSAKILSKERSLWTKHQDFEQRAVLLDKVPGYWAKHGVFGKRARFLEKRKFFGRRSFWKVFNIFILFMTVLRIRIPQIHMFWGLPDPDLDPLVRGMDPDPSIIMQK